MIARPPGFEISVPIVSEARWPGVSLIETPTKN